MKLSYNDCKTWAIAKVLEPGVSGYSDLAVSKDGCVLCAYGRGTTDGRPFNKKYVCLAKFNLEWLTDGKDSLKSQ